MKINTMNKQSTTSQADRQIKFRAWDNKLNMMHENAESFGFVQPILPDNEQLAFEDFILERDRFTLLQWTGLLDKNGKEIYELDVVEYSFDNTDRKRGVIRYQESSMRFVVYYGKMYEYHIINSFNEIVVIGNVHANSNLLEG